jgi:hypothetical protein
MLAVRLYENILHDILGLTVIAQDDLCGAVEHRAMVGDDLIPEHADVARVNT